MISEAAIANALGQRLATLSPALSVAWPNKSLPVGTPVPYLIFEVVPVSRTDDTLRGGATISRGFAVVTVISALNAFATSATTTAESIASLYPYTLRLPVTGGEITITQPPEVMQGYPDDTYWRTPVKINYEAS